MGITVDPRAHQGCGLLFSWEHKNGQLMDAEEKEGTSPDQQNSLDNMGRDAMACSTQGYHHQQAPLEPAVSEPH